MDTKLFHHVGAWRYLHTRSPPRATFGRSLGTCSLAPADFKYRILPHYRGYETRIACATTTPPKKEKFHEEDAYGFATSARKKQCTQTVRQALSIAQGLKSYAIMDVGFHADKTSNGVSSLLLASAICRPDTSIDTCIHMGLTNVGCIIARNDYDIWSRHVVYRYLTNPIPQPPGLTLDDSND